MGELATLARVGVAVLVLGVLFLLGAALDLGPFRTDEVSRGELIVRADQICAEANRAFIDQQEKPPQTREQAAELTDNLIGIAEDESERIAELEGPADVDAQIAAYLEAREGGIDLLREGREAAEEGNSDAYEQAQKSSTAPSPSDGRWRARSASRNAAGRSRATLAAPEVRRRRDPRRASQPKPSAAARLKAPANQRPSRAPGRENDADCDHTTSVAISVPRSHASAHQSSGSPRRSATRCAAAKLSQIGPQRRKRWRASGEGSSWPRARRVASGASSAPVPSARSKAIRLRLVSRSACSRSMAAIQPHHCGDGAKGKAPDEANQPAVSKTATKTRPASEPPTRANGTGRKAGAAPKGKALSTYITERFDEFSRSQKDVARYIVDHLDEAAFQTAEELARRANTSSSTVVRFSQALGFEGYPELQQAAIEEYRSREPGGDAAAPLFDFDHSEFEASLAADHANVEETVRNLTREQVEACVTALAGANRVMVVGLDQLAFFASYLRHLLALLDIRAEVVASPRQDSITRLSRVDEDSLVIAFSAGRAHPIVVRAMKLAKHRGAADDGDHRRDAVGHRPVLRPDALLLLERSLVHALQHLAAGDRAGARAWRLRPRQGRLQGPDPRLQAEVAGAATGGR